MRKCEHCDEDFEPESRNEYVCRYCRDEAKVLDDEERREGDFDYSMNG